MAGANYVARPEGFVAFLSWESVASEQEDCRSARFGVSQGGAPGEQIGNRRSHDLQRLPGRRARRQTTQLGDVSLAAGFFGDTGLSMGQSGDSLLEESRCVRQRPRHS